MCRKHLHLRMHVCFVKQVQWVVQPCRMLPLACCRLAFCRCCQHSVRCPAAGFVCLARGQCLWRPSVGSLFPASSVHVTHSSLTLPRHVHPIQHFPCAFEVWACHTYSCVQWLRVLYCAAVALFHKAMQHAASGVFGCKIVAKLNARHRQGQPRSSLNNTVATETQLATACNTQASGTERHTQGQLRFDSRHDLNAQQLNQLL